MAGNGQHNPPENKAQGSTFAFRKRWGQIDWRSLASVDVDRIAREIDFQALQQNIMNVTFCNIQSVVKLCVCVMNVTCNIQSEEFHNVDPNFIKLFRLSQLITEYLLHSQQYLSEQGHALEQRLQQSQQELESLQGSLSARMEELKTVKKENRKRRKVIEAYQEMMSAGATGLHACPVCQCEFVSAEYLQSHIHRRHPEHLSLARREGEEKKNVVTQEDLEHRLLDQLSERLQTSEAQLREEMARKCEWSLDLEPFCYTINTKQAVQTSTLHCCELHVTGTQGLRELKGLSTRLHTFCCHHQELPTLPPMYMWQCCHVRATAGVSGPAKEGDGQKGRDLFTLYEEAFPSVTCTCISVTCL